MKTNTVKSESAPKGNSKRGAAIKRAIRLFDPRKVPGEYDQSGCLIHFLKIGPTRGGTGFSKQPKKGDDDLFELFCWTEDPKSDIPFFYIKFKSKTVEEEALSIKEITLLLDSAEFKQRIMVDPTGSTIDCIIVPIKHDGAIHWNGVQPRPQAVEQLKKLCQEHGIWTALSFSSTSCNIMGLPWEN
jgi:hypothetical protein